MRLRPVVESDCELLWYWANDEAARTASFDARPIAWGEHVSWFRERLNDGRSRIYVIETADGPVGVVRFALAAPSEAVVSVNIAAAARGRGLGPEALRRACALVFEADAISVVTAYIKPDNAASLRAFEHAGFVHAGTTVIGNAEAIVMRKHSGVSASDQWA